jgi:hypothetical protein
MLGMKDTNETVGGGKTAARSSVLSVCSRLGEHSEKVEAMLHGFEVKQVNNTQFSLNQAFSSSETSLTKTALMNLVRVYGSLRDDVRQLTGVGFVDFEVMFPKIGINFETYYSVAVSLLNLIYQMRLMKLYCYLLLES